MRDTSIRTPAWGVTSQSDIDKDYELFQFAPPHGGDRPRCRQLCLVYISIRTPAWGVTGDNSIVTYANAFQFAPPRGG